MQRKEQVVVRGNTKEGVNNSRAKHKGRNR